MTEVTLSIEAAFSIILGFIGLIITLAAGYSTLRERIKTNEVHTTHIMNDIKELKQLFYEVMKSLKVQPRTQIKDKENG